MRVADNSPAVGTTDDEPSTQHHYTKFIEKSDVRSNLNTLVKIMKNKTPLNSEVFFSENQDRTEIEMTPKTDRIEPRRNSIIPYGSISQFQTRFSNTLTAILQLPPPRYLSSHCCQASMALVPVPSQPTSEAAGFMVVLLVMLMGTFSFVVSALRRGRLRGGRHRLWR